MNYNVSAYIIYLCITVFITIYVGWICYKNGKVHLLPIFTNNTSFTETVNKLLLTGYYLINIGYAAFTLQFWDEISSIYELITNVSSNTGIIVFFLGVMHYFNIWATSQIGKIIKSKNIIIN